MAAAASHGSWTPHESLTTPPTNLKEAIDWVLRVTGRDGKKNTAAQPPAKPENGPHCLCFLAKAVKDLLYDAKDPGSPGPSSERYWDGILLDQESAIAQPVLTDLGLLGGSTGAASSTCAGGTEVIKALIDQLAQGLQKWVGWQDGEEDKCCLKGDKGIGKGCKCPGVGVAQCCGTGSATCHDCSTCGTKDASNKCYLSAYCKKNGASGSPTECYYWPTLSDKADQVHLLARIFLGSVCLIWSGLSQLGFLTKEGSGGRERWKDSKLHEIKDDDSSGLGSFMAAMGYDLERLNNTSSKNNGIFVQELLKGEKPDKNNGIKWKEFKNGVATQKSVAEYYSSIYDKAKEALKNSNTESICKEYPLLVLHILASGYFRAGSAGANKVTPAPSAPPKKDVDSAKKPRHPRTIREILYWLSALPYSQGYRALVGRMQQKTDQVTNGNSEQDKDKIQLYDEKSEKTELKQDCLTHYLMAACGYCPLVLIGIQGTIEREVKTDAGGGGGSGSAAAKNRCPEHSKDRNHRCDPKEIDKTTGAAAPASTGEPLKEGQVCYGGYHLEVSKFGPLHGMYANGLFGFQMEVSPAQCLDQLRIYVYHCFYQLYFLRKQCSAEAVLGWKSCRYGSGVYWGSGYSQSNLWRCKAEGSSGAGGDHTKKCGLQDGAGGQKHSPLMCFLCDGLGNIACPRTVGRGNIEDYPSIEDHMNMESTIHPTGHLKMPQGHCPVPMGWQAESGSSSNKENHFKDLTQGTHKTEQLTGAQAGRPDKYPVHCTGRTLSHLLEYYCDPEKCHGALVVLLRLLACITPTVPRTLGDLFGFYYYIVYIGGNVMWDLNRNPIREALKNTLKNVGLGMLSIYNNENLTGAISKWKGEDGGSGGTSSCKDTLKCLTGCTNGGPYLSPLSGQQYGQLSPLMAGTYLSWLVYLIEEFQGGLQSLVQEYKNIQCKEDCKGKPGAAGCDSKCVNGKHGDGDTCCCTSVVSCTGVLPVLYKYGFGYGNVETLHKAQGPNKQCHEFLTTLNGVLEGNHLRKGSSSGLHHEINKLIYTTRLPWIFVLTLAWLVAVLYLAFGAIWPLDWTHMRSHCRGWFRKGRGTPWEILMAGKKKGRGILEFFGGKGVEEVKKDNSTLRTVFLSGAKGWGGG